jgi:hypothetical protein
MLSRRMVDVALIDGLHTYQQSLTDVFNILPYLRSNGVILLHDCSPTSELMARSASSINELIEAGISGWDGAWSGDVWKTIVHLRSLRDDVSAFVIDCDNGVGVVTLARPMSRLRYSKADIIRMEYNHLAERRKELLGLQSTDYFWEFLRQHTRRKSPAPSLTA